LRSAGDMPEKCIVVVMLVDDEPRVRLGMVIDGMYHVEVCGMLQPYSGLVRNWMTVKDTELAMLETVANGVNAVPNMPNLPPPPARNIGTGAEALAMEMAAQDLDELCRVRRVVDGMYLRLESQQGRRADLNLRWAHEGDLAPSGVWPRRQASAIATAMIAFTGDHGIEVEPVEG